MDVNTSELRKDRQDLVALAKPQSGVAALKGQFSGPTREIAGVKDTKASAKDEPEVP
jgi:hypothetical protein